MSEALMEPGASWSMTPNGGLSLDLPMTKRAVQLAKVLNAHVWAVEDRKDGDTHGMIRLRWDAALEQEIVELIDVLAYLRINRPGYGQMSIFDEGAFERDGGDDTQTP